MYECPLCGKTANRKGDTFDSVQKVVGHIDGCHDDTHADVRGEEFIGDIEAVDVTDDAPEGGAESGGEPAPSPFDTDSDDGPPDAGGGDGVAAAAVAGGGTETTTAATTEPPEFEQEAEEDEEELVVMPQSELEEMESGTASTTSEDSESSSETSAASGGSSSSSDDEMDSLISTDPVEAGENAKESGWSLGAILLWMGVVAVVVFAWNVAKEAARQKSEQAQNAVNQRFSPADTGEFDVV